MRWVYFMRQGRDTARDPPSVRTFQLFLFLCFSFTKLRLRTRKDTEWAENFVGSSIERLRNLIWRARYEKGDTEWCKWTKAEIRCSFSRPSRNNGSLWPRRGRRFHFQGHLDAARCCQARTLPVQKLRCNFFFVKINFIALPTHTHPPLPLKKKMKKQLFFISAEIKHALSNAYFPDKYNTHYPSKLAQQLTDDCGGDCSSSSFPTSDVRFRRSTNSPVVFLNRRPLPLFLSS